MYSLPVQVQVSTFNYQYDKIKCSYSLRHCKVKHFYPGQYMDG